MTKNGLLAICFVLLSSQLSRAQCHNVHSQLFESIHFIKSEPDCAFLEALLTPLLQVPDFFQKDLNLNLLVREKGINASYDHGTIIWIPKKFYAYNNFGQVIEAPFEALSPILLHEIGHFFLHQRLKKEFVHEFGDLFSNLEMVSNTTLVNALAEKPSMSSRRFGDHLSQTPAFKRYQKFMIGYAELYADTVSVLYFNDLDIITRSLEFLAQNSSEKEMIQLRSFSKNHSAHQVERIGGLHGEFAPMRSFLGQVILTEKSRTKRIVLLQSLEEAIVSQIKYELKLQVIPNVSDRNSSLIQRFKSIHP